MSKRMKAIIIWVVAIVITLAAAYYQRKTGPTYPAEVHVTFGGTAYNFELPTSWGGEKDAEIRIEISDSKVSGELKYRRAPGGEEWTTVQFVRDGKALVASLPHQPPAGKLEYYLTLSDGTDTATIGEKAPIAIRFKGDVPMWALLPHIGVMFLAMLISNVAGLFAAFKDERHRFQMHLAFWMLIVGGMIFGPLVQFFAFGSFWTGVPFGWDLTDNKTLIAVLAYLIAVIFNRKGDKPYLALFAAIVVIVVFSIPHSIFGSELDYSTGKIGIG
jgi:hypothetical protein